MKVDLILQDKKGITEEKKKSSEIQNAEKILMVLKRSLIDRYPGIGHVLHCMEFVPVKEKIQFETDGVHIFYSAKVVLMLFRQRKLRDMAYRIMHIVAHGLLRHFEIAEKYRNDIIMHTLMDQEVHYLLEQLSVPIDAQEEKLKFEFFESFYQQGQQTLFGRWKCTKKSYVAKQSLFRKRKMLKRDDHHIWSREKRYHMAFDASKPNQQDIQQFWKGLRELSCGMQDQKINQQILSDSIRTGGKQEKQHGSFAGGQAEIYRAAISSKINYSQYLKQFFRAGEREQEDVDSIDKALYAWGSSVYEDIVFIEPEMEKTVYQMHTVILAIDTSGSCEGSVMSQFLAETKKILKSLKNISFEKLIILQCDAEITHETIYTKVSELPIDCDFEQEIYGFGGTSFIPVFEYTDRRVQAGEKVDCLIYLTDGYGDYPEQEPKKYQTFFVLQQDDEEADVFGNKRSIPDWITTLYLE